MERLSRLWACGLFEGEGTIIIRPKLRYTDISISLTSTDQDVVRRFAAIVSFGKVYGPYQYGKRKPFWKWNCDNGLHVTIILSWFLPDFMTRRRKRAKQAVAIWNKRQLLPHYLVSRKRIDQNTRQIIKDKRRKKEGA